jgi:hypothetical protein
MKYAMRSCQPVTIILDPAKRAINKMEILLNMGRCALVVLVVFMLAGCGGDGGTSGNVSPETFPKRVEFTGVGSNGVFDASLTEDEADRIWMSYSEVDFSPVEPALLQISTRIAFSDSQGEQWQDTGAAINPAESVALPSPLEDWPAVWQNEVSRLLYDPYAGLGERWKLLWHKYLGVYDVSGNQSLRLFEHGWIAMKAASSPEGPWSPETKLFTGALYNEVNDSDSIGPPEYRLDRLFPGPGMLGDCMAFSEPGMLVTEDGVYISLLCSKGVTGGKILLMKCDHDFTACDYLGDFIDHSEAGAFNPNYNGFSASELVRKDGQIYLIVTPTQEEWKKYSGCMVFSVKDLQAATLERSTDSGLPIVVLDVSGSEGSFNGACGCTAASSQSGIIYSEYFPGLVPEFRLFSSGKNL